MRVPQILVAGSNNEPGGWLGALLSGLLSSTMLGPPFRPGAIGCLGEDGAAVTAARSPVRT